MNIRIFKRINLGPFVRLTITNSGWTVGFGYRGIGWLTFGKRGLTETLDTPVSGIYVKDSQPWDQLRRWIRRK
jgi:hypothetical protein